MLKAKQSAVPKLYVYKVRCALGQVHYMSFAYSQEQADSELHSFFGHDPKAKVLESKLITNYEELRK